MTVFARRRIQEMLNTIGPLLTERQLEELIGRIEHQDTRTALAAEFELGLLWAMSTVDTIELHPVLAGTERRPEAYCPTLFPSAPAYVEITAISDDSFSDHMERAANIICAYSDRIRKGSGKHLHFHFAEKSGYEQGHYRRYRRVSPDFRLTSALKEKLEAWLENANWPDPKSVRLTDDSIDVITEWRAKVYSHQRTFCSMPALAYDLEDNPVYKQLRRKRSQLSGVPDGFLKCVFLVDAGCETLRNLRHFDSTDRVKNGERIIWHFLDKSSVDIVVVFSPQSQNPSVPIGSPRIWRATYFDRRGPSPKEEYKGLAAAASALPPPQLEGYQARSLHRQGAFHPQRLGWHLETLMHVEDVRIMRSEIRFSARMFQEFVAGRIDADTFRRLGKTIELFNSELKQGRTICSARLEPAGLDEDDDYLVFEFAADAAARPLQNPKATNGGE